MARARVSSLLVSCVVLIGATTMVRAARVASQATSAPPTAEQIAALQEEGEAVYQANCASCHGADGTDGTAPKLAGNPSLENKVAIVRRVIEGVPAKGMPPFGVLLTDRRIAAVTTFLRTSWENPYGPLTEGDVQKIRAEIKPSNR